MIYLDAAATAKHSEIDTVVIRTMTEAMEEYWENPSSLYATYVKEEIDKCRSNVARFIGAKPEEIVFTSGASESNNMAIRGWVDKMLLDTCSMVNVITTPIEHKSIMEAVKNPILGACVRYCDVDEYGLIDCQSLKRLLELREGEPILVSVGLANNEIGTIQDIKRIADLVHSYGGIIHTDITQAFGHIPINVKELGVDMASASGHKISPILKGVGFLYKRNGIDIQPLIYGSQENGLRGGTENTFGIVGLSKAVDYCDISTQKIQELCDKRHYFIKSLKSKFSKSKFSKSEFGIKLNGHKEQRLPNNINVTFLNNITGEALLYTLETSGIYVSTGSACNSKTIEPSYVLKAIGLTDEQAMKTVRFSLPDDITYEEIDKVINEIDKAIKIIEV